MMNIANASEEPTATVTLGLRHDDGSVSSQVWLVTYAVAGVLAGLLGEPHGEQLLNPDVAARASAVALEAPVLWGHGLDGGW